MHTYALIVGIVSLVVGLLLWFLQAKKPETLMKVLFNLPKIGDVTVESLTAFFLFAWWCVGAGILTFQGPFTQTTNGYFATWAGLVSSTLIAGACMPVRSTSLCVPVASLRLPAGLWKLLSCGASPLPPQRSWSRGRRQRSCTPPSRQPRRPF